MNVDYIVALFYHPGDTFSKSIIERISSLTSYNVYMIPTDKRLVRDRILSHMGDVNIPLLVVKDADGGIEHISGVALQKWVKEAENKNIPQQQQENNEGFTPLYESPEGSSEISDVMDDGPPIMSPGDDPMEFQSRLKQYYEAKNGKSKKRREERIRQGQVKASDVMAQHKDDSVPMERNGRKQGSTKEIMDAGAGVFPASPDNLKQQISSAWKY